MNNLYALDSIAFFAATALVVVFIVRSRAATKRLLIEQGLFGEGYAAVLAAETQAARWTALRWGLVIAGIGAGLLLNAAAGFDGQGAAAWGTATLGAGLGYVAYFFASRPAAPRGAALALLVLGALSSPARAQPVDHEMASEQWYSRASDRHATYVYEIGRAEAPGDTVVVLHGGWGADHSYLTEALRPLGDTYRLVFYDQRGSLRSPAPDSTITLQRLVEDLDDLRADAGLDRMTLVAHSMGNHLAYAYLAAHPDRVRGLVLVGAVLPAAFSMEGPDATFLAEVWPDADTAAVARRFAETPGEFETRGVRRQAAEGLIPARFADVTPEQALSGEIDRDPDIRAAYAAMSDRERTRAWRIQFAAVNTCDGANWRDMQGGMVFYNGDVARAIMSQPDFDADVSAMWPALKAFAGPVRVIDGTCDYTDPGPTVWPHVVDDLQDAALTVVDGAGHSLWMDRPAEFVAAMRASLADATR